MENRPALIFASLGLMLLWGLGIALGVMQDQTQQQATKEVLTPFLAGQIPTQVKSWWGILSMAPLPPLITWLLLGKIKREALLVSLLSISCAIAILQAPIHQPLQGALNKQTEATILWRNQVLLSGKLPGSLVWCLTQSRLNDEPITAELKPEDLIRLERHWQAISNNVRCKRIQLTQGVALPVRADPGEAAWAP